ncbi:MAG: hypothetical protein GQ580_03175 [Candidatus Thorarchaeota archaeon]|nr:hypothetical protein [Candidatus Thorarchaeota archaeon]
MLIAIGLTTVVLVGIPILLFAVDTLGTATQLEMAQNFSERVHNETQLVDTGANNTLVEISVPTGVTIAAEGSTLTVSFLSSGGQITEWEESYSHPIVLQAPSSSGPYLMQIAMIAGIIELTFTEL